MNILKYSSHNSLLISIIFIYLFYITVCLESKNFSWDKNNQNLKIFRKSCFRFSNFIDYFTTEKL